MPSRFAFPEGTAILCSPQLAFEPDELLAAAAMSGGGNSDGPLLREHQDAVSNWTSENHECIDCGKDGGHHDWSNVLDRMSCPCEEWFAYRETTENMSW